MKPLNNAERKAYRLRFIGMYCLTVVLIIIILCSFFQPAPAEKIVMTEKEKPAKVITKTVYVTPKKVAENNFRELDSLKAVISFNEKKLIESDSFIQSQKNTIAQLQVQPAAANKPVVSIISGKNEIAELKKQIKFYDWALRSQIAVTNTLTKENKSLKEKIQQPGKSQ